MTLHSLKGQRLLLPASELATQATRTTLPWGLIQVCHLPGGSRMELALSCIANVLAPPSPLNPPELLAFIADEGLLYAPALVGKLPLSRLLMIRVKDPVEAWKATLETVQTGLFSWVWIRPSRICQPGHLRRLQLLAEKMRTRVVLLAPERLPRWLVRTSID